MRQVKHPFSSTPFRIVSFCIYQITSVATTKALRNLPLVQVEVLASSREEMALRDANVTILCNLVLEWIHRNWEPAQLNVDQLTAKVLTRQTFFFLPFSSLLVLHLLSSLCVVYQQTHLLYLNLDNSLHDCVDIESGDVIDSDIVQDYKKMSLRLSQPGSKVGSFPIGFVVSIFGG
jgi:influenza virus NS1A-binding protein